MPERRGEDAGAGWLGRGAEGGDVEGSLSVYKMREVDIVYSIVRSLDRSGKET